LVFLLLAASSILFKSPAVAVTVLLPKFFNISTTWCGVSISVFMLINITLYDKAKKITWYLLNTLFASILSGVCPQYRYSTTVLTCAQMVHIKASF